jgi:dehydrogenase/reductase SDR family protein 12
MHPGWADTPGVRQALPGFWRRMRRRLRTAEQGADTIAWLAVTPAERLGSGKFWFDRRAAPTHIFPWTRESAQDRQKLWDLCCRHAELADRGQMVA